MLQDETTIPTRDMAFRAPRALAAISLAVGFALPSAALAFYHGSGQESEPATGQAAESASGDVVVVDMDSQLRFASAEVRIEAGQTVEWRNVSSFPHTVTADPEKAADMANVALPEGAEPFDSGRIAASGTFRQTFTEPGEYRYVCLVHEDNGMLGTVIVE